MAPPCPIDAVSTLDLGADDTMPPLNYHTAAVETWHERLCAAAPSEDRPALIELAFSNVWARAGRALGGVTLAAIMDRVLAIVAEDEPILSPLRVTWAGLQWEELHALRSDSSAALCAAAVRLLTDFLSILGELTAEILSTALHDVLAGCAVQLPAIPPTAS